MKQQNKTNAHLARLDQSLDGTLKFDRLLRTLYATDASVYKELPLAVAYPKTIKDLKTLIHFARQHQTSLIPRTAGTSLAGQCVGSGIVVDVSRHFTKILELSKKEAWVRVQPGVVRDELNAFLKPHGYFFSPITSTANRAMIGGMVGNNSCGSTSIVYGSTRDHVLELKTVLSDGSLATFHALSETAFQQKLQLDSLEGEVYRHIYKELNLESQQEKIKKHFPKPTIHRRNTGYAVDYLLKMRPFTPKGAAFDFCKMLCGSEGTLAFTTEIKLHLDPLPDPYDIVVAAHYSSIRDSMKATQFAMQHAPTACELMDKTILDCTKNNIEQSKNRHFIEGDPKALLLIEFREKTLEEAEKKANALIRDMQVKGLGYAFPKIRPPLTEKVWALRKAGLGLLANIPGDKKAVACIEDTAVALEDLADYINEFAEIMKGFGQESVYYAHAGAGEIHLRPILNLKKSVDVAQFYKISLESAKLVKKYQGSLSGEHGDGRVRATFIPLMVGKENYALFQRIKQIWDPSNIFNPGKIVNAPPMNSSLRYKPDQKTPNFKTLLDFSAAGGLLRLAEKCNGSGDCRKLPLSGGTMCPSYQATKNEKDTTRARANALRAFLTEDTTPSPFDHPEIKAVMDLCLSCKGCTAECPSSVDMASLKAEFLHQYHQIHGVPLRARAFAYITKLNRFGAISPGISNFFLKNSLTSHILKNILRVAPQRSLPILQRTTLRKWYKKYYPKLSKPDVLKKKVYLFCDEFTNYNDTPIGIKAIQLLTHLGYEVKMVEHPESGRAALSKGLLKMARRVAAENINIFKKIITRDTPIIGIEPSAILSFRDEYPRLVRGPDQVAAKQLANNTFLIDEFIAQEIQTGNIISKQFTKSPQHILLHGHCHQKALASIDPTAWLLSLPENYTVDIIPSGCCGMAGSFGYEKEHYEVSQQIGELILFPSIRKAKKTTIIAATGTSCRHQIWDGIKRKAVHPIEILWNAFENKEK